MKKITKLRKVLEHLDREKRAELLASLTWECNGYDGSLDNLRYEENDDEFFDVYFEGKPQEAVRASYFGNYSYTDCYVCFNGYGNLDTISEWEFESLMVDSEEEILQEVERLLDDNSIDIDWLLE